MGSLVKRPSRLKVAVWQEIIKLSENLPCKGDLKPESHRKE